ncbi:uncharacterized protein LOC131930394 [Physella acuta]|uniref:uncharacterized protein LOC131930394 n=1 Tax=Physella acuta TaxID=109671 RepID=UPI0027DDE269|nr:uncharacterized protein LOC131930394 [Physella acuta]
MIVGGSVKEKIEGDFYNVGFLMSIGGNLDKNIIKNLTQEALDVISQKCYRPTNETYTNSTTEHSSVRDALPRWFAPLMSVFGGVIIFVLLLVCVVCTRGTDDLEIQSRSTRSTAVSTRLETTSHADVHDRGIEEQIDQEKDLGCVDLVHVQVDGGSEEVVSGAVGQEGSYQETRM